VPPADWTGALLQARTSSSGLTILFGSLLLFVAASELTGLSKRMRFRGAAAWIAGALSGLLGGLVGNQAAFDPRRCSASMCPGRRSWVRLPLWR
jgi:uncharacterized membrane protein YfcA